MVIGPFVGLWPLFSSLILYTVRGTPWTGDQLVVRPLPTHRTIQTQNKYRDMDGSSGTRNPVMPQTECPLSSADYSNTRLLRFKSTFILSGPRNGDNALKILATGSIK
jgi:hypothetical protein